MQLLKCFLVLFFLAISGIFLAGENQEYPIYLRLRFDGNPESEGYEWAKKVKSANTRWAEEQNPTAPEWKEVGELPRRVKVGVALGGGVVRGIAHIGVLRAFEENNIPINAIAGTSMGAIIGGMYACGYSPDSIESIVMKAIDWEAIFIDEAPRQSLPVWIRLRDKPRISMLDFNMKFNHKWWPPQKWFPSIEHDVGVGVRTAQNFTEAISLLSLRYDLLSAFDFNKLHIPFGAIITNLNTGKVELKRQGTIATACRASGSLPIALEPMRIGKYQYADGGILDNLPVDAFFRFDETRAPQNNMRIIEKDTISFVIAIYPGKRSGDIDKILLRSEFALPLGLDVLDRAANLAREQHIINSWEKADARIDIDITGGLDFTEDKFKEVLGKGYSASWTVDLSRSDNKVSQLQEIYRIKHELIQKEAYLKQNVKRQILYPLESMDFKELVGNDVLNIDNQNEIDELTKAVRIKKHRSDSEEILNLFCKIDICDCIKRIYNLGGYKNVMAKIEIQNEKWIVTFYITRMPRGNIPSFVFLNLESRNVCLDWGRIKTSIEKTIAEIIGEKSRVLNFVETRNIAESLFVEQGFIRPEITDVFVQHDSLILQGSAGTYLRGCIINEADTLCNPENLVEIFLPPLNENTIRKGCEKAYKELQLRNISVQGARDDKLIISAREKSGYTAELPSITLENHEGPSLFGELRKRKMGFWSAYANYTTNIPLKESQELPKARKLCFGLQRSGSLERLTIASLLIEGHIYWRKLQYASIPESLRYDKVFKEYNAQIFLPIYFKNSGFLPGIEFTKSFQDETWDSWGQNAILWARLDNLNRRIFPETGIKLDLDSKIGFKHKAWSRIRGSALLTKTIRSRQKWQTTFTSYSFVSWFDNNTPQYQRYSMGGITPPGSYQVRLYDYEDLPGFARDKFVESLMWKTGFGARILLKQYGILGINIKVLCEGKFNLFYAGEPYSDDNRSMWEDICIAPSLGLHLDTNYLNVGIIAQKPTHTKTDEHLWSSILHHLRIFAVHYSLGF